MRSWTRIGFLILTPLFVAACSKGFTTISSDGDGQNSLASFPEEAASWDDSKVSLDSYGESFSRSIATQLKNSHYMEGNCKADTSFAAYGNLPVERCSYSLDGQKAEVSMLNPGPRRLTAWLVEACTALSSNLQNCVQKSYDQILNQSGAMFPVAGIVIEDMDQNGMGNAYAFREGVTVRVPSFSTATESLLTTTQIQNSFTDAPMYTYSYGRPISVTRTQLANYSTQFGLGLPYLGNSTDRDNAFNVAVGQLYRQAWLTGKNHIIRAWILGNAL